MWKVDYNKKRLRKINKTMLKNKSKLNYIIDILMFICFLVSAIYGVSFLTSPRGPRAGWHQLEGIKIGDLRDIHIVFGVLMILFVIIHFILHLDWIITMTKSFLEDKNQK